METQVLIVGAGPTGLALALWLAKSGVRFRIVEKNAGPGEASRAMVVQARTLEFYRQLGFAAKVVAEGIPMERLRLREGGREVATIKFGDFGKGISPYPFVLSYPQDDHERLLVEELQQLGIEVEWNTELARFEETGEHVRAVLQNAGRKEPCTAEYLCGCDGSHSTVRETLGLKFPGGTYEQLFFVADVEASGTVANADGNICLGKQTLYVIFPVRRPGMQRLIGAVPPELSGRTDIGFKDVRKSVEESIDLHVTRVNWFSTYRVHHRVTEHFRVGRAFIAGDAAHIHSPAGGQGMNTGIGDAVNLGWKVAAVAQGRAAASILDTYEPERIGFARSLVETTDRLFQLMVGTNMGAEIFRTLLLPHMIPLALEVPAVRRSAFRLLSQTGIHYPASPLSAGKAGDVHGGDRLPWAEDAGNFDPLRCLEWQVHVYGEECEAVRRLSQERGIPLHVFAWTDACEAAGFKRDAFYLVRPDGYVAVAGRADEVPQAASILDAFQIALKAITH